MRKACLSEVLVLEIHSKKKNLVLSWMRKIALLYAEIVATERARSYARQHSTVCVDNNSKADSSLCFYL